MNGLMVPLVGALVVAAVFGLVPFWLLKRWTRVVPPHRALILTGPNGELKVARGRALVMPGARAEEIDLSVQRLRLTRVGRNGLRCRDKLRVDLDLSFWLKVNDTHEDILKVARTLGAARAADPEALLTRYAPRLLEAAIDVIARYDYDQLNKDRARLRNDLTSAVGQDLDGYVLSEVAIESLAQTPLDALDPNDLDDAEAILKITTAAAAAKRKKLEQDQEYAAIISKSQRETDAAISKMKAQVAEAEARKAREIKDVQARVEVERNKIRREERAAHERLQQQANLQRRQLQAQLDAAIQAETHKRDHLLARQHRFLARQRLLAVCYARLRELAIHSQPADPSPTSPPTPQPQPSPPPQPPLHDLLSPPPPAALAPPSALSPPADPPEDHLTLKPWTL